MRLSRASRTSSQRLGSNNLTEASAASSRAARADKAIAAWGSLGGNFKEVFRENKYGYSKEQLRNAAIACTTQAKALRSLSEEQVATRFANMAPQQLLSIVMLVYPNLNRGNIFNEFALTSPNEAVFFVKPYFAPPFIDSKDKMVGRTDLQDGFADYFSDENLSNDDGKSLIESFEYRQANELANAANANLATAGGNTVYGASFQVKQTAVGIFTYKFGYGADGGQEPTGNVPTDCFNQPLKFTGALNAVVGSEFGEAGEKYIDGYTQVYYNGSDRNLLAIQHPTTKEFLLTADAEKFGIKSVKLENGQLTLEAKDPNKFKLVANAPAKVDETADKSAEEIVDLIKTYTGMDVTLEEVNAIGKNYKEYKSSFDFNKVAVYEYEFDAENGLTCPIAVSAFGRFNAETDYNGEHLGEVQLKPTMHRFNPRRTSIGVSWTQLTDLILETGYDLDAQSILVEAASQTINSQLDYQAVKMAVGLARTNKLTKGPNKGKPFQVTFDASYSTATATSGGTKDSYMDNAQTFTSAIATMSSMLYNELQRGAITHLVCGLDVATYIQLLGGYTNKGKQSPAGVYKFGELDGIQLFVAPTDIIPTNEALAVYKNDRVDNDVAMSFGTLLPLTSTGVIQRKNFYQEVGIATYGDVGVFNKKYLGIIKVTGLKDSVLK